MYCILGNNKKMTGIIVYIFFLHRSCSATMTTTFLINTKNFKIKYQYDISIIVIYRNTHKKAEN